MNRAYFNGLRAVAQKKVAEGFLLDEFPNAFAAFSLRQLRTGVTSVVRVRRDSDDAEQDFTADEITNGTLTTFVGTGNDGFVKIWYDQSGIGNDVEQDVKTAQARIVNNGNVEMHGGKPTLNFYDNALFISYQNLDLSHEPDDIFTYSKALFTDTTRRPTLFRHNCFLRVNNTNDNSYSFWRGSFFNSSQAYNNEEILTVWFELINGGSLFINGNTVATNQNVGSNTINFLSISHFETSGNPQFHFDGFFQEHIVWDNNVGKNNRVSIENNINAYYDVF